ncbi:uncharacterized protein MICPUCDRAFT_46787 [Micromonas pusilla CCMP1545]|jgi:hypothetical protein|uniref:Predicted protein n=1 Tax=Micromonas pusilla (strain CCMP1545) TaxID=564608 RepID=C1MMF2_MICPC|nr:uncharacterized protein MICPUCDRAFT_46787 [Micromonas pusilla CCMP1545]EEH59039.1 predicted protein [Micromonas pusilla CCMP1545]|eukprot:XP_003057394.1 predicted protein [Micromonas pusilla CCMP1545]
MASSIAVPVVEVLADPRRRRARTLRNHRCPIDNRGRQPTTTTTRASSAAAADAQQAEFTKWRDARDIKSPNVEVAYFGDPDDTVMRYRGVKAKKKINPGDVLVELPRESCLVLADDAELPFPDFCTNALWSKLVEKNKWALRVALNLLHETSKGAASPFHAYTSQLPKSFDLLSEWSDDELKMLQYAPVVRAAEGQRKEDDDAHAMILKLSPSTPVTKEEVTWALNMVRSRVFSGRLSDNAETKAKLLPRALAAGTAFATFMTAPTKEGRWLAVFAMLALVVFDQDGNGNDDDDESKKKLAYVLLPLIDAFNHKTMQKTEFEFSSQAFRLRSPATYGLDDEVLISYGLLGNDELIVRYGFVDAENEADIYAYEGLLSWLQANHAPMKQSLGAAPDRVAAMRAARLESYVSMGVLKGDGAADDNLMWALRTLMASPEDYAAAGGTVDGMKLGGGAPEKAACVALAAACKARLGSMPTSAEDDEKALRAGAAVGRERTAIEYRLRKKKILQAAVARYDV